MKYEDTLQYKLNVLCKETAKIKKEICNFIKKILDKIFKWWLDE